MNALRPSHSGPFGRGDEGSTAGDENHQPGAELGGIGAPVPQSDPQVDRREDR